ncbi:MAG: HAD family hydrolase [Parcubacteria group bacterium]|jgi:FMN phosphatase YigB (HAD superfamily)
MNKKIVIFDLLGVITKESMFATNIIYPLVKNRVSYDLFKKKYLLYAIGNIEAVDFWKFICLKKEIKKIEEKIIAKTLLTSGIRDIIHNLTSLNCELYLATEIPKRWGELLLDKAGIKNMFKKKFYSSDLLTTKPFSKFYELVFENIKGNDIYHVDDTLINLIAAQEIKKHTKIFYNYSNDIASSREIDYKINNLNEIEKICKLKK